MFKATIKNLTLSYIFIIFILTSLISILIYTAVVQSTSNILKNEEVKLNRKFGSLDTITIKKMQFAEESILEFRSQILKILVILNLLIITIVGFLSYSLAKRNIKPIETSLKKQKDFVSNVSHELKTPLTALKSSFEIELRSKNPDFKEAIKSGIEEVDKMNKLINGFLKLSSLERTKYKMQIEELKLKEILDDIFKKHKDEVIDKRIELIYNLNQNILYTDKFLISELLSIIISNSIKFNKNYGKIIISAKKNFKEDTISIKDTGEGIEKEKLERIFDRFYKTDESRNSDGYGIGLSIAKEILAIYKAKIDVVSKKNEGTEITIKFSEIFKK